MTSALQRLVSLQRRRPVIGDGALVALLIVAGVAPRIGDLPTTTASRAFTVALVVPLLWRRRHPVPVLAVIVAIAAVQWGAGVRAFGDLALLVALYGVAVTQPSRVTLAAGAVKHAGPGATAHLHVRHDTETLEVRVLDTADGRTPSRSAMSPPGAGLRGMRERAAVYDGALEAGPEPGNGWQVHLVVPLARAAVSA